MHFDLQKAVAGAGLAPSAANVEGEPARAVAAERGILRRGENIADIIKEAGIRCGVAPRRAADGRLVDGDDLIDIFKTVHACALAGAGLRAHLFGGKRFIQYLVHERGLARAGHTGHADKLAEREADVDIFKIVLRCSAHGDGLAVPLPACAGQRDTLAAA